RRFRPAPPRERLSPVPPRSSTGRARRRRLGAPRHDVSGPGALPRRNRAPSRPRLTKRKLPPARSQRELSIFRGVRVSADEQHLLIRRERPEVVGDDALERVGRRADLLERPKDLVTAVPGLVECRAALVRAGALERRDAARELIDQSRDLFERLHAG